jgi:membrane protease YdiL (CAAX protease family)
MHLMVLVLIRFIPLTLNVGLPVIWTELLLFVTVWYLAVRQYRLGWETLGLRRFPWKALGVSVGLLVLFNIFSRVYEFLLTTFHVQRQNELVAVFATHSSPWWLWIGMVVAAPAAEELFFRGFVLRGLRPRYGWQKAAGISAVLFAMSHLHWPTFLPGLVLGYLLAYLYERSHSIWPGMLLHAWINAWILGAAYAAAQ